MKRIGQAMLGALFTLLLLLSCQKLVQRPQQPEEARKPFVPPAHTSLAELSAEPPLPAGSTLSRQEAAPRRTLPVKQTADLPLCSPEKDGNGTPLTGQSYIRTVYNVRHPESTSG